MSELTLLADCLKDATKERDEARDALELATTEIAELTEHLGACKESCGEWADDNERQEKRIDQLEASLRQLHSLPIDSMSYTTTLEGYAGAVRTIVYEALESAETADMDDPDDQETIIVYFGCWSYAGHFLWGSGRRSLSDLVAAKMLIPIASHLDGSKQFLPHPEKIGTGSITYLPAPNRTILAWWGNNPWDQRGAVNSAIITNGKLGQVAMWQRFVKHFPDLSEQLKQPTIVL